MFLSLFGSDRAEYLAVRVPWTVDTEERIAELRQRRRYAWIGATVGTIALVPLLFAPADRLGLALMTGRAIMITVLAATVIAAIVGLVVHWRVRRDAIVVELDASRRWVTLRNVHPAFHDAVRAPRDRVEPARP